MTVVRKSKHDDAVSPIIGVMLMLVVTIVVAAVVAAFAGGLSGDSEPASIASLKLDSYEMGTVTGVYGSGFTTSSYSPGLTDSFDANNDNYAVYGMTFQHMGGDLLTINDLTLVINYNAAAFSVPFSTVTEKSVLSAGEKVELHVKTALKKGLLTSLSNQMINLQYGLNQQNMLKFGMDESFNPTNEVVSSRSFDWSIIDGSGHTIASGTASTKLEQYGY